MRAKINVFTLNRNIELVQHCMNVRCTISPKLNENKMKTYQNNSNNDKKNCNSIYLMCMIFVNWMKMVKGEKSTMQQQKWEILEEKRIKRVSERMCICVKATDCK